MGGVQRAMYFAFCVLCFAFGAWTSDPYGLPYHWATAQICSARSPGRRLNPPDPFSPGPHLTRAQIESLSLAPLTSVNNNIHLNLPSTNMLIPICLHANISISIDFSNFNRSF